MIRLPARPLAVALLVAVCAGAEAAEHPDLGTAAAAAGDQADAVPAPSAAPVWLGRPVTPAAVDVPSASYIVAPGDTLRRIAARTGAGAEAIARANGLVRPFDVAPGRRLHIPGGRYHPVQPGQSGIAIARAYAVDWSQIVSLNALEEPYVLRAGMRLLLPSRRAVARMSPEQRAAAFRLDLDDLITGSEPALAAHQRPARPTATPAKPLPSTAPVGEPARFEGRFGWPLTGKLLARFGAHGGGLVSNGVDIAAAVGTPVLAAADGTVAYVGSDIPSLGRLVLVRHGGGWITAYAHASALLVTRGQTVRRGQVIARSGASGAVEQPLLHFEIRQGRGAVDPLRYLPPAASKDDAARADTRARIAGLLAA